MTKPGSSGKQNIDRHEGAVYEHTLFVGFTVSFAFLQDLIIKANLWHFVCACLNECTRIPQEKEGDPLSSLNLLGLP